MTVILGYYGSEELPLGPNCSRLVQANPFFVQSIQVVCRLLVYSELDFTALYSCLYLNQAQGIDESKNGPMLYGFHETPPLDVEITWSETHKAFIQSNYHEAKNPELPIFKLLLPNVLLIRCIWMILCTQFILALQEWEYFLNTGSSIDISYSVKSPSSTPLSLVIAQGKFKLPNYESRTRRSINI